MTTTTYKTVSTNTMSLNTVVPSELSLETNDALSRLKAALGGDVTGYVAARLHMSLDEIEESLAAEQVDGVALALYNIECKSESVIIGDQTGVGKGRQAAALIRYGMLTGYLPVFFTDRYTLFSDMYRDCKALGISDATPLIINKGVTVVDFDKVVDENVDVPLGCDVVLDPEEDDFDDSNLMNLYQKRYEVVYKSPQKKEMDQYYADGDIPSTYNYLMITYSQLKDVKRSTERFDFLQSLCQKHNVLFVFDEAHRSSSVSDGKVSVITQSINQILEENPSSQCVFLSATFAKRPESFITFMRRTSLRSLATESTLNTALKRGGTPMQEYVSSILASEGQMIRREHSSEGLPLPTYNYLESSLPVHSQLFDKVMYFFREMVEMGNSIIDVVARVQSVGGVLDFKFYRIRQQLFYVNKVLLLALKAKDVAEIAVRDVKDGKSVVIGMSDTLECILQDVKPSKDGQIRGDMSTLLMRLLEKVVHGSDSDLDSSPFFWEIPIPDLPNGTPDDLDDILSLMDNVRKNYLLLKKEIKGEVFHLPMSPIDVIRQVITREEFIAPDGRKMNIRFEECTGRTHQIEYASPDGDDDYLQATVTNRKKRHSNHIFNDFQNNKLDVILINACGAIGASAHAVATSEVPDSEVRQRKMLIVQNDLDVNIDLQKRGRINRTGQRADLPPLYEYVITSIPSEKRLNMMLRAKLRSLSANTTASQDQDKSQADFLDISNKYGDMVAKDFVESHPDLSLVLGLRGTVTASNLMARTAMLDVSAQQDVIDELFISYITLEEELRRINQWDLEREFRDFDARLVRQEIFTTSFDDTKLGGLSYLGTYKCRHKTFPMTSQDVNEAVAQAKTEFLDKYQTRDVLVKEVRKYYKGEKVKILKRFVEKQESLTQKTTRILEKHVKPVVLQDLLTIAKSGGNNVYHTLYSKLRKSGCTNIEWVIKKLAAYSDDIARNESRKVRDTNKNKEQEERLLFVLDKFTIGKAFSNFSQVLKNDECPDKVYGVLKEIKFGKKAENRFLPSQVEFVFALSAISKEVKINVVHNNKNSNYDKLVDLSIHPWKFDAKTWDKEIARNNNRVLERKIITGNILGAFSHPAITKTTPRFIKFTRWKDGKCVTDNGLLLPMDVSSLVHDLKGITLPLNEGFKFANQSNTSYPISGAGVTFNLFVSKSSNDELCYEINVTEFETKKFEENKNFDKIRSEFIPKHKNVNGKTKIAYYTTAKHKVDYPGMLKVIKHLSQMKAAILVDREFLTKGELDKYTRAADTPETPWKALDWKGKDAMAVPPVRERSMDNISLPVLSKEKGAPVDRLDADVALAKETLSYHGQILSISVKSELRDLLFDWRQGVLKLRFKVIQTLESILVNKKIGSEIDLSDVMDDLSELANRQHLSPVGKFLERFEREFQFLSPSKEDVRAFLDTCPCSSQLDGEREALQKYLDGKTDAINYINSK